jgi:hypothetical protein
MRMATFSVYVDVPDTLANGNLNVEGVTPGATTSLVGGNSTLSGGVSAGAQSLPLVNGSTFSGTFELWILDGQNSESVRGCTISTNTITVPAPGVAFAHSAGVSCSSAGTAGCLASIITRASALVESICGQGGDATADKSLFRKNRTELLRGPNSFRAAFDSDNALKLRPYHFPIISVASVSVQVGAMVSSALDLTYLQIPDGQRMLTIPYARYMPAAVTFRRDLGFMASLTYTAGPAGGLTLDTVPMDIRDATYLLILDVIARRQNPQGAASVTRGNVTFEARLRGDKGGKSINRMDAEDLLQNYTVTW